MNISTTNNNNKKKNEIMAKYGRSGTARNIFCNYFFFVPSSHFINLSKTDRIGMRSAESEWQ